MRIDMSIPSAPWRTMGYVSLRQKWSRGLGCDRVSEKIGMAQYLQSYSTPMQNISQSPALGLLMRNQATIWQEGLEVMSAWGGRYERTVTIELPASVCLHSSASSCCRRYPSLTFKWSKISLQSMFLLLSLINAKLTIFCACLDQFLDQDKECKM